MCGKSLVGLRSRLSLLLLLPHGTLMRTGPIKPSVTCSLPCWDDTQLLAMFRRLRGLVAPERNSPNLTESQTKLAFCTDELFLLMHFLLGFLAPFVDIGPWYGASSSIRKF